MKTQLLIAAGGLGARLGKAGPKALVPLRGEPMLVLTLRRFESVNLVDDAIIVVPPAHADEFRNAIPPFFPNASFRFVNGGAIRQESVSHGLDALDPDTQLVVIHDAARPFVGTDTIRASIEAAQAHGAATVATPCTDTILHVDSDNFLEDVPDRSRLWQCQTPQTFLVEVIRSAHRFARETGREGTDDSRLVLENGGRVKIVPGSPRNIKITRPEDLGYARYLANEGHV